MKSINWDDLRIFLSVARAGGLSAAARQLGISVPTAGRRMLALEEATAQSLFLRSQSGYALTKEGEVLFSKARSMEAAARPLGIGCHRSDRGGWCAFPRGPERPALWQITSCDYGSRKIPIDWRS